MPLKTSTCSPDHTTPTTAFTAGAHANDPSSHYLSDVLYTNGGQPGGVTRNFGDYRTGGRIIHGTAANR